jgi:hypothetical protein
MYSKASQGQPGAGAGDAGPATDGGAADQAQNKEDVVEAEFEEVKE